MANSSLQVYDSGRWKQAIDAWVFDSGAWKQPLQMWIYNNSMWKLYNSFSSHQEAV